MSLKELNIKPEYRTDTAPPLNFYISCLKNCTRFDRAAGFFSSSGLSEAAQGFAHFIHVNGRIRLVVSPEFEDEDYKLIKSGYKNKAELIEKSLLRSIEQIENQIHKDRFAVLAWMLDEGILEIKIAVKISENGMLQPGIFHEKSGIFYDEANNAVAFTGSANETRGGLISNFESIDVYLSWNEYEKNRVTRKAKHFKQLWSNQTKSIKVYDLPSAVRKEILRRKSPRRPVKDPEEYGLSEVINSDIQSPEEAIKYPDWLELYEYQQKHIDEWFKNECIGFFCMATGTGKTITALACATQLYNNIEKLFVLVTCPNTHLVNQWNGEAKNFGFLPLLAFEDSRKWTPKLKRVISSFKRDSRKIIFVITTQSTLTHDNRKLARIIEKLDEESFLFIADEAHNLGSFKTRKRLPKNVRYKIALSATPNRYFDDIGSKYLKNYFGEQLPVEPEVDLKFAIGNNFLCRYRYYPHVVFLNDQETEEYHNLSKKIKKLSHLMSDSENDDSPLQRLFEKRVAVLNNAQGKYNELKKCLKNYESLKKSLFYCSDKQIVNVIKILNEEKGILAKKVTYEDKQADRKVIFREFENGIIDAMCAIGVLDEGLDIPSTKSAFFLASSGNPRQFIQRRGRILRKPNESEKIAMIYDFISLPKGNINDEIDIVRKALEREMKRFKEFCMLAENKLEAMEKIWDISREAGVVI